MFSLGRSQVVVNKLLPVLLWFGVVTFATACNRTVVCACNRSVVCAYNRSVVCAENRSVVCAEKDILIGRIL